MTELMVWAGVDETKPYPWAAIPCLACGETELSRDYTRPVTGFVCMACGLQTTVERR